MAQFDVHANHGRNRARIPFVVVLQSARFEASRRRVVAPLLDAEALGAATSDTMPDFTVGQQRVVLDPFQIQTVPREALGERVGSLADDMSADAIQRAIDELFSRAFG
jgi:toxin CcdB